MRLSVRSTCLAGLLLMQLAPLSAQSRPQRGRIPPPAPPSIYELLDQYVTGDVNAPQRFAQFVTEKQIRAVEDQSTRWVNANPTTRDKRRLAVATFILEVAKEWQGTQNWVNARRLISWACHEFGSSNGPPQTG